MSDATEQGEDRARNPFVERAAIILGAAGAVVALITLVGLSWQLLAIAQSALAWIHLGIAALALTGMGRGRPNVRAIVVAVIAAAVYVFWIIAPEAIGALPIYAYLLTAALAVALGLATPRLDTARARSVLIACGGVVVFTAVTAVSRLGG
ncbi:MAG: hypothetical protein BGO95_04835 [Micrococcales bacterium 73-13]|nr:MAG: hypothetical protein BGO95_04835 [Micrococcales bacterium 73-13]